MARNVLNDGRGRGGYRRDPHIAFGMLGVPGWVAQPLSVALDGSRFRDLPMARAAFTLTGFFMLQLVRAVVLDIPAGGAVIMAQHVLHGRTAAVVSWLGYLIIAVNPIYALVVLGVWKALDHRSRMEPEQPAASAAGALAVLRAAPYAAAAVALPLALALAS